MILVLCNFIETNIKIRNSQESPKSIILADGYKDPPRTKKGSGCQYIEDLSNNHAEPE